MKANNTTYCIVIKKDGDRFRRVVFKGLSIEEARKELLDMFNRDFDTNYTNWGLAVNATKKMTDHACETFSDGTRWYCYDTKKVYIEEDIDDEDNE